MSKRYYLLLMLALPILASAQSPSTARAWPAPNALTMHVIIQQRPATIPAEQWKAMMLQPVNASLYPIRITQALLDTIDATQLDMRYQYIMVQE
ncbi:MAG: hypothetical protein IPI00_08725 [Flavobacteriales bacterium]|nr:hypothetical protein [Flavobacteriales bacterium]MBK6944043.1 hypothetical protein [Flavobacteriales bacterium]MBK7240248.1 hypothetical protein [Flavobacteriales bacterium]MBK7295468.1 hypothetical protein [Flavobacteriales bacterium]MBK9533711.1 hypothetical protein [Flavobacteriales bacterium]